MDKSIYSVGQLNNYIKNMVQSDFLLSHISVRGEVSNFKGAGSSGHLYFTLKDRDAEVSVAMWKSRRSGLKGELKNGASVTVTGSVDVYTVRGTYQIIAERIEPQGLGELFVKYEELTRDLADRGMFDEMYKKPIPEHITTLGVVTAETGAAIRDVIQIAHRRNPYVRIILSPARVQGEGAAESIAAAIERLDAMGCDVMIVGRGGGSIEDLWAFNEEPVAYAIFNASTPVISAVGHETDTTIADYVADRRAPTPSAAAEIAVFSYEEFRDEINRLSDRLSDRMERIIGYTRMRLATDGEALKKHSPENQLMTIRTELKNVRLRLDGAMEMRLTADRRRLSVLAERIDGRSPAKKLAAGYAYVRDSSGRRLVSVDQVTGGDDITLTVSDGSVVSRVEKILRATPSG
ncbi:MAG: exodeoxyribonuclease VII large subunit [Lachnospiraceae bacterium]|nr:exodeoxyribonuclease VII large subunit [Lachnospiraceae bacterium]